MLSLGTVFLLFFITLGPLKLLGPFAQQTRTLDEATLRGLAVRVFILALLAVLIGGTLGTVLLEKWRISIEALVIATGIIFFLVALDLVMAPYRPPPAEPEPLPAKPIKAALRLTFPLAVTPYGIAAVIAVLVGMNGELHAPAVYAMLVGVMLLNLLAMLYIRQIMVGPVLLILQILGAVLGVLQVALAVQIMIRALRDLHVLPELS